MRCFPRARALGQQKSGCGSVVILIGHEFGAAALAEGLTSHASSVYLGLVVASVEVTNKSRRLRPVSMAGEPNWAVYTRIYLKSFR